MSDRPIRDILAEAIRIERMGPFNQPSWADWKASDDAACENVRRRADHLIRLLAEHGVSLMRSGDPDKKPAVTSPTVLTCNVAGNQATERSIRKGPGDDWHIVAITAGVETIEQAFTLQEVMLNAGLVLTDDPAAKTIPGLGRRLAAVTEIYRLCAATMGGQP